MPVPCAARDVRRGPVRNPTPAFGTEPEGRQLSHGLTRRGSRCVILWHGARPEGEERGKPPAILGPGSSGHGKDHFYDSRRFDWRRDRRLVRYPCLGCRLDSTPCRRLDLQVPPWRFEQYAAIGEYAAIGASGLRSLSYGWDDLENGSQAAPGSLGRNRCAGRHWSALCCLVMTGVRGVLLWPGFVWPRSHLVAVVGWPSAAVVGRDHVVCIHAVPCARCDIGPKRPPPRGGVAFLFAGIVFVILVGALLVAQVICWVHNYLRQRDNDL